METIATERKKELTSNRRIQFSDCDSFGHLNNAAYLNYFMNTREEQVMEEYNISFPDIFKQYNAAWVVGETRVVYLSPAQYGAKVKITTRITQTRKSSVITEGVMMNDDGNVIHAIALVNFVWVDIKSGRPKLHPEEIMSFLESVNTSLTVNGLSGFEERVKGLRKSVRKS